MEGRDAGAGGEVGVDLPHLDAERWSRVRKALEASALRCVPPRAPAGQREARALCLRAAPRSPLSSRVTPTRMRACRGNVQEMCTDRVETSEDLMMSMQQYLPQVVPRHCALLSRALAGWSNANGQWRRTHDGKIGSSRASSQASLPR